MISETYLHNIAERYKSIEVTGITDRRMSTAEDKASRFGVKAMSYDELIHSPEIDVILNLTNPSQHFQVSMDALSHGKHVYEEKPLALSVEEGEKLLDYADKRGLSIGCAPDMFLGSSLQTMYRALNDGWIGEPVAAAAAWSSRGHERWHSNPGFYYQNGGGPLMDMGPYYITALVAALGSVSRVSGMSKKTFEERTVSADGALYGEKIPVNVDTHYQCLLEFENGIIATLFLSFDVWKNTLPNIEIYGTHGTLIGPDPNTLEGSVKVFDVYKNEFYQIPSMNPFTGNVRGIGLAQMCKAIENGTPTFASGELALHCLDVMESIGKACQEGKTVSCTTSVKKPPLFEQQSLAAESGY